MVLHHLILTLNVLMCFFSTLFPICPSFFPGNMCFVVPFISCRPEFHTCMASVASQSLPLRMHPEGPAWAIPKVIATRVRPLFRSRLHARRSVAVDGWLEGVNPQRSWKWYEMMGWNGLHLIGAGISLMVPTKSKTKEAQNRQIPEQFTCSCHSHDSQLYTVYYILYIWIWWICV